MVRRSIAYLCLTTTAIGWLQWKTQKVSLNGNSTLLATPLSILTRSWRTFHTVGVVCMDYLANGQGEANTLAALHQRSAERFARLAYHNKGVYIKIAQHASSLDYLLPKQYVETLKHFQDHAPQSSFEDVTAVIQEELGLESFSDVFSAIQVQPVGSASLAQVHFATLRETGDSVAIKVQHRTVQHLAEVDIRTTSFIIKVLAQLFPNLRLDWLKEMLEENLPQELDFLREGRNAEEAKELLAPLNGERYYIRIPSKLEQYCWEYFKALLLYSWPNLRGILEPSPHLFNKQVNSTVFSSQSADSQVEELKLTPSLSHRTVREGIISERLAKYIPSGLITEVEEGNEGEVKREKESGNMYLCDSNDEADKRLSLAGYYAVEFHIPKIFWEYTTPKVLVMERCEGVKINDAQALERQGISAFVVAQSLCKLYSKLIFGCDFVHADPHPGNLTVSVAVDSTAYKAVLFPSLASRNKALKTKLIQINILDHGLYCRTSLEFRRNYCHLWYSILNGDFDGIKQRAEYFNVEDLHELFACVLSGRTLEGVSKGVQYLRSQPTEAALLRQRIPTHAQEIFTILQNVPRELVLLLKSHDLVRSILRKLELDEAFALLPLSRAVLHVLEEEQQDSLCLFPRKQMHYWWKSLHLSFLSYLLYEEALIRSQRIGKK